MDTNYLNLKFSDQRIILSIIFASKITLEAKDTCPLSSFRTMLPNYTCLSVCLSVSP